MIIRGAICATWLTLMVIYVRFEAYPEWFTDSLPGYSSIISDSLLQRESWGRVLVDGKVAGYTHSNFGIDDEAPLPILEINHRLHLNLSILGRRQRLLVLTDIFLDDRYQLQRFEAIANAGDISFEIKGTRQENDLFEITSQRAGGEETSRLITIPSDRLIYTPAQEIALRQMRPGQSFVLKVFDPLTQQPSSIVVAARKRETISFNGNERTAMPVDFNWNGMNLTSWIGPEGQVLRQETPLGWLIEACTPDEAIATIGPDSEPVNIAQLSNINFLMRVLTQRGTTPDDD